MNLEALAACTSEAFDARYAQEGDPWKFSSSQYELDRYDVILKALGRDRYQNAFEPGCSIGVLTERLAERCGRLLATDFSERAIAAARVRCERFPHVRFGVNDLGAERPNGTFDLIVFSEIGYYFPAVQLRAIATELSQLLEPDGEFIAVHWRGQSPDHVLHGDDVHAELSDTLELTKTLSQNHSGFRLDRWTRQ